jgi:2-oxoglutarate ferredoxin oxidoreductase subunit alpha
VTTTSGPGISLKSETIALGVMTELPLVICDIQRAGPSTGMPTKTEQADLLQVMFGRNGEAPVPVLAAQSPADCFPIAIEAVRIAVKYRTPVIVLSDGYIANGAEPWQVPDIAAIPPIDPQFAGTPNAVDKAGKPVFLPYLRDEETLARPWAIPGTPGLQHRVGGLEKADKTGNIDYTPQNHQLMGDLRAEKIARIANDLPELEVNGDIDADTCILGWGSTWAAIHAAVQRQRRAGNKLAWIHLTHLNPLPNDLGEKLSRYGKVLVPELNRGQLCNIIRAKYLIDAQSISKVAGLPFTTRELENAIERSRL